MAEEVVWKSARSPLSLLSYWIVGVVMVITIILSPIGLIVILLGVVRMYRRRYSVTTERVKSDDGFISHVTRDAELDKIQDTLVKQNFLGRILNYGDLYFSTAGSTGYEIMFDNVADPEGLKAKIRDLKKK
jgi:uncharacterized membrane protein YdbT with pleckstrin-like domain